MAQAVSMKNVLIVLGHPNPASFSHALAQHYEVGARLARAHVETLELGSLAFDPVLRGTQALEPDLLHAQAALLRAEHVAWFFPTWWAGPPALVKGFIDRVFLPGFAYRHDGGLLPTRLLSGRTARLVTSMDAPWLYYALWYRGALHHSFMRATLGYCGFSRVQSCTIYSMRKKTARQRERLLELSAERGAKDARSSKRSLAQLGDGTNSSKATPSTTR